jgi:Family of unknown function (DUF6086)
VGATMSIYFISKDAGDLWNPASVTGRIFCEQVESIGRVIGIATGLGAIVSDEVSVDKKKFLLFAEAFAQFLLRTDPSSGGRMLLDGCFSIVGAVACKLGAPPPLDDAAIAGLIANGRRVIG